MEHGLESRAISFSEFFFSSLLQRSFLLKGVLGGVSKIFIRENQLIFQVTGLYFQAVIQGQAFAMHNLQSK